MHTTIIVIIFVSLIFFGRQRHCLLIGSITNIGCRDESVITHLHPVNTHTQVYGILVSFPRTLPPLKIKKSPNAENVKKKKKI